MYTTYSMFFAHLGTKPYYPKWLHFRKNITNRIIEILPNGSLVDKITTYDEYLASDEMARKRTVFTAQTEDDEN